MKRHSQILGIVATIILYVPLFGVSTVTRIAKK